MLWIELWARAGANEPLRTAQEELDQGWQEDLAALLGQGAAAGVLAVDDSAGRAGELLALLDGLSTRVVLGQRGADRKGAIAAARSAAQRLVGPRAAGRGQATTAADHGPRRQPGTIATARWSARRRHGRHRA
ncbi:TetR family transcriptional regulator C-terminal domain-containing protein [Streptomyces sp. 135]|uniref:TetR family transcriptional regulator C-terminal domain-containing protein n=1 Tax=Streptomyces sp. 135 TaxID=2838850 RepID=UPI0021D85A19|nr:TetR family transcriptional regulator C-terminal domain-containing protein [Streptomyces sp. 135]